MHSMKFTVSLPPSTNSLYATNHKTGRRFLSQRGQEWRDFELPKIQQVHLSCAVVPPVFIVYKIWFRDKRRRDAGNFLKLLEDTLFSVLGFDDHWLYYRGYTVMAMGVDKVNPRIEVTVQQSTH